MKEVKDTVRAVEMANSTISTILKDKDRVKDAVKVSTVFKQSSQDSGMASFTRWKSYWQSGVTTRFKKESLLSTQEKARSVFAKLKEREGEESTETFTASHGWFQSFRRRFNLHNRAVSGLVSKRRRGRS